MTEPRDMEYEELKTQVQEWLSHARWLEEARRHVGYCAASTWLNAKDETMASALRGIHLELGIMHETAMGNAADARRALVAHVMPRNKDNDPPEHEHCDNEDCQLCYHVRALPKKNDHET